MSVTVLIGAQWGDEGKGKIIDVLAPEADVVARYQGGNNAGHTVIVEGKKVVLHLIPSGVHSQKTLNVIGNGVVMNPVGLCTEIDKLASQDIEIISRLEISSRCHLVFSYHQALDAAFEAARGADAVGTTKKGIGPTYADKVARCGLRGADLCHPARLEAKFRTNCGKANTVLASLGAPLLDVDAEWAATKTACTRLAPLVTDTVLTLNRAIKAGKNIMLEGAQGVWLDIDYGTYPYVTSSNTGVGGAVTGTGIAPQHIKTVIGVAKAYTTRVGGGPFPTELCCDMGEKIRKIGNEFGSTTGRPRRTGWFDAVATSYAVMLNGITELVVTKMDVLDGLDEVKICTAYELDGNRVDYMPADAEDLARAMPVYESMPGWKNPTKGARSFGELPLEARNYLNRVAELCGAPVKTVSVGPDRAETFRV